MKEKKEKAKRIVENLKLLFPTVRASLVYKTPW